MDLNAKVEDAIKLLRRFRDRPVSIQFSGGKDSLACLLLSLEAGLKLFNVIYVEIPGNTHRECTEFVVKVCEKLGIRDKLIIARNDKESFWDCFHRWGVPNFYARWCTHHFKANVWERVCYRIVVAGMKRSDSILRSRYVKPIFRCNRSRLWVIAPLYNWTTADVLDYLRSRGLRPNPLYSIYGHSGNCMFCPFYNIHLISRTMQDPVWGRVIYENLVRWLKRYGNHPKVHKKAKEIVTRWLRFYHQSSLLDYLDAHLHSIINWDL